VFNGLNNETNLKTNINFLFFGSDFFEVDGKLVINFIIRMKKIKIFLASSNELKPEREQFEIEIYRKCKAWFNEDIFIHLDIWEDLSARMSLTGLQSEYNKFVNEADLFVLLAYSKVGNYTEEEFENAFGQFKATKKPFIFTYFKTPPDNAAESLAHFKEKLSDLKHFYADFKNSNDLWNQFNKELEKLEVAKFKEFKHNGDGNNSTISGDGNTVIQGNSGNASISTGNTSTQNADKIYNIEKIDKADFNDFGYENDIESYKQNDDVNCTLFAPQEAISGNQFLIQVFTHTDKQTKLIDKMARLADDKSSRRGTSRLPEVIKWNTKIVFNLILQGLIVDEPSLSINWLGEIVFVQFGIEVPNDFQTSDLIGKVIIAKNSIPIGQIKFKIKILSIKSDLYALQAENSSNKMRRFENAFISYASQDRQEVLKRVQMLNLMSLKFFQDVLTLEPGQRWEKEINKYIDNCDVFFLFWSKAASQSEWVMKEVSYANNKKGNNWDSSPEIIPVIIEGPPLVKPPEELNFLHFNDRFVYFINSPPPATKFNYS
jgi:TIR domain